MAAPHTFGASLAALPAIYAANNRYLSFNDPELRGQDAWQYVQAASELYGTPADESI